MESILHNKSLLVIDFVSKISSTYGLENLVSNLHVKILLLWSTLVKLLLLLLLLLLSLLLLLLNLFIFIYYIAYKCIRIVLNIGLCVSIKHIFSLKKQPE